MACREVEKERYYKNAVGAVLVWHQTGVRWCWDRQFKITGKKSWSDYGTPFYCWKYERAMPTRSAGGAKYWEYSRGSTFSCGVAGMGAERQARATIRVYGGGKAK